MHYTKNSILTYQSGVELLLRNSLHKDSIKQTVVRYGYDEKELNYIYGLNKELTDLVDASEAAKNRKRIVYHDKSVLLARIKKDYMRYLKLTRIALADDVKAGEALILNGARARTINEFVLQMTVFVSNLLKNKDWLNALNVYSIQREDIEQLNDRLKELSHLSDKCLEAQGEVRRITSLKKKKLVDIQGYVSDYVKVVRIAFEEKPGLLVSLGIKAKG
ncbi:MAG: hypothetical protein N4A71_06525 [Carboxylicivirga sp.]|jgi:hypothetical protein|nr:hypothetical protein [Carboxylicivirga sp.]